MHSLVHYPLAFLLFDIINMHARIFTCNIAILRYYATLFSFRNQASNKYDSGQSDVPSFLLQKQPGDIIYY